MRLFVKGDIDGLFALGLDNMLMLILMSSLCQGFLGFSSELFFSRILPATAIGLAVGNFYYARAALKLAAREHRTDVTALPYGTSVLTVVAFVFLAMYPVQQVALERGLPKAEADLIAWQAGLIACFGSGVVEFIGSFVATRIKAFTPRAALLSTIAGIGLAFIALDFVFRCYTYPLVGLVTLGLTSLVYFGRVRLKWGLPVGFVIIVVGTAIAWVLHFSRGSDIVPTGELQRAAIGMKLPVPVFGDLLEALQYLPDLLPILAPVGFIHLILSLQNIESAEAAGDKYEVRPALIVNGLGTMTAASFGSPFPTSIYIGHPGWKAIGARAGYSVLNAVVLGTICLTGTASVLFYYVPVEAGMAILIWIGISMMTQAFQATPSHHAPAIVFGVVPVLGAYVALCLKHALAAGGIETGTNLFDPSIEQVMIDARTFFSPGVFALEQGYVYTSLILAAATVCIIERRFRLASLWFVGAAMCALTGLTTQYRFVPGNTLAVLGIQFNDWFFSYLAVAGILFCAPWITEKADGEEEPPTGI